LKIIHLHSNVEWGGGEEQILLLAASLKSDDYFEPCIYTPANGLLFERAKEAGLKVYDFSELENADCTNAILHAHDSAALNAGQKLKAPLVYTRRIISPLGKSFFSRRKYSPAKIDQLVAVSETVKEVLVKGGYPADKIKVVQDALDLNLLDAVKPVQEKLPSPRICGLGKLSPKKNWKFFIDVMAELKEREKLVYGFIAGEGPERKALETQISRQGLQHQMKLLGFRKDALGLLKASDILLFPSLAEGASVSIRQAMVLQVPVVCLDTSGCTESLNGYGWIAESATVAEAADLIETILSGPDQAASRTAAGRADACSRFSLAVYTEAMREIYSECI